MRTITEADWKVFRKLHPTLVNRYCERVLLEINRLTTEENNSHHERYLASYETIQKYNGEMARLFDNPRRSSALMQLMAINAQGLLTAEERMLFSDDTVNLLGIFNSQKMRAENEGSALESGILKK